MDCLIDNLIKDYTKKGKTMDAIRKYMAKYHNISIDSTSIRERVKRLNTYLKGDQSL